NLTPFFFIFTTGWRPKPCHRILQPNRRARDERRGLRQRRLTCLKGGLFLKQQTHDVRLRCEVEHRGVVGAFGVDIGAFASSHSTTSAKPKRTAWSRGVNQPLLLSLRRTQLGSSFMILSACFGQFS